MGETSIALPEATKDRLDDHRGEAHDSYADALEGMMEMLPDVETIKEGCMYQDHDEVHDAPVARPYSGRPEDVGGVIRWFHTQHNDTDLYGTNYYCSPECLAAAAEEHDEQVPEEPDKIIVGGKAEPRTEIQGAEFQVDGDGMSVTLPIPGALGGTSDHGNEYEYVGEPLYIHNAGRVVQHGIVDDILHEDRFTFIDLGYDTETVMLNHPNEEKREEYKEEHEKWTKDECAQCGGEFRYMVSDPPGECPYCNEAEW